MRMRINREWTALAATHRVAKRARRGIAGRSGEGARCGAADGDVDADADAGALGLLAARGAQRRASHHAAQAVGVRAAHIVSAGHDNAAEIGHVEGGRTVAGAIGRANYGKEARIVGAWDSLAEALQI